MKITNIGGATAIIEHRGKRMLFDPWMDDGIFHGSWFHYPPMKMGIDDLGRLDYVFISHIHEDHCSAGTIKHLNKDAEIIIADRNPNFVLNFLKKHQFKFKKIHLVKPRTPLQIEPGLVADIVTADPKHEGNYLIDSALLLNWDGFILYNANDCGPYPDGLNYIKKNYPKIDLALLPYTGGSGYPACFTNLTHEDKMKEKHRIFKQGLNLFIETIKILDPIYAMPFADQYIIGGSRSHLNRYQAHPTSLKPVYEEMENQGLVQKALLLNSAQTFDFSTRKKYPEAPYHFFTDEERENYIQAHLQKTIYDYEHFELNSTAPLDRLLKCARDRLWIEQNRQNYFPNHSFYIDVPERQQRFHIDLRSEDLTEVPYDSALMEPYLKMTTPGSLLMMLLVGHISWNIADGALFIDYERNPNVYDPQLFIQLNYLRV